MLQHSPPFVSFPRRFTQQPCQHQTGARLHRGGDETLPEGIRGVSWICSSSQQPGVSVAATGKTERSVDALQGGDPHQNDIRRRLQQHGQHTQGDARHPGALQCYTRAIQINPAFADAHSNLASIHKVTPWWFVAHSYVFSLFGVRRYTL